MLTVLPLKDTEYLQHAGISYRTFDDGTGWLNIELIGFPLPAGLNVGQANVLFRLAPSYPDTPPDMWWVIPHLSSTSRGEIAATQVIETYDGRTWQRCTSQSQSMVRPRDLRCDPYGSARPIQFCGFVPEDRRPAKT